MPSPVEVDCPAAREGGCEGSVAESTLTSREQLGLLAESADAGIKVTLGDTGGWRRVTNARHPSFNEPGTRARSASHEGAR